MAPPGDDAAEDVLGYADRLRCAPGETLQFMVSGEAGELDVEVVRLLDGPLSPPGRDAEPVELDGLDRHGAGVSRQEVPIGSYVAIGDDPALRVDGDFTFQLWMQPTLLDGARRQALLGKRLAGQEHGYALAVLPDGRLAASWDGVELHSERPVRASEWYFVACTCARAAGRLTLVVVPCSAWLADEATRTELTTSGAPRPGPAPLLLAAELATGIDADGRATGVEGHFDGKLEGVRLWSRALSPDELETLRRGEDPHRVAGRALVAAWDFAQRPDSTVVVDCGPRRLHGVAVNCPTRAVTSHAWDGGEIDFRRAPEHYAAIHFHREDLEDARWSPTFALTVPTSWRSGVYAARVRTPSGDDEIPFFVTQQREARRRAGIGVLFPTFTYMAYANRRFGPEVRAAFEYDEGLSREIPLTRREVQVMRHPEIGLSLYDRHADGRRCCVASRLRPLMDVRRDYVHWATGTPRHFSADLGIVGWLERHRRAYAALTDEDVHHEGVEALQGFDVVVIGSHPEYVTDRIWTAVHDYLAGGGQVAALSGNAFFWVTSVAPDRPHLLEVRRGHFADSEGGPRPGELHHSFTGEPGGVWKARGRSARQLFGIGTSGIGHPQGVGYLRTPASHDPRAAFVFAGVEAEVVGEGVGAPGGVVSDEFDSADVTLGTPPQALVLATSAGRHPENHIALVEDPSFVTLGDPEARGQADMVLVEMPTGGRVFSVGSMAWPLALTHEDDDRDVSRITANVLDEFSSRRSRSRPTVQSDPPAE